LRFEFEVGDLVECIVQRSTSNLSMHEARRAYLQPPDTIPAVIIGKSDEVFDGVAYYMYKIRRADGKVLKLRNGIYPIGHFKDKATP